MIFINSDRSSSPCLCWSWLKNPFMSFNIWTMQILFFIIYKMHPLCIQKGGFHCARFFEKEHRVNHRNIGSSHSIHNNASLCWTIRKRYNGIWLQGIPGNTLKQPLRIRKIDQPGHQAPLNLKMENVSWTYLSGKASWLKNKLKNWKKEYDFIIIRGQYGSEYVDEVLEHNSNLLDKQNMKFGVYSYSMVRKCSWSVTKHKPYIIVHLKQVSTSMILKQTQ